MAPSKDEKREHHPGVWLSEQPTEQAFAALQSDSDTMMKCPDHIARL